MNMSESGITILGLGPGDPQLITRQTWSVIDSLHELYVRTKQHPVIEYLKPGLQLYSFDYLYEQADSFASVYQQITEKILELGKREGGVAYAVPGNPFVAEITSLEITRRAKQMEIPVRVLTGTSFLEPIVIALELDPFQNVVLIDALELADLHVPPFPPSQAAIIAQIYSAMVASDVKLCLSSVYPDETPVKLIHAAGTPHQLIEEIALFEIDRSPNTGLLTSLFIPSLGTDTSFEAFQEIVARLRAPDGCPWDKEQTHSSLRPFLLEETYELISALDENYPQKIREELGDLLLQILLHSQIGSEEGEFTIHDVLQGINRKIVHRHPHVFGTVEADDSQTVVRNWELIKQEERAVNGQANASALDSVSPILPALSQASQYQQRAARVGFDWENIEGVWEKVFEELEEVKAANNKRRREEELGDLLFVITNLARWYQVDAETALRGSNGRFYKRYAYMEEFARQKAKSISEYSLNELDEIWERAKTIK
jgi:tetrapyrrole methylase family protein/MazG family protein